MCFSKPRSYFQYFLKEGPKKKEKKEEPKRYIVVEEGAEFYQTDKPQEAPVLWRTSPTLYQYCPAGVTTTPLPGHVMVHGPTKEEFGMHHRAFYEEMARPHQFVPYKAEAEEQFWCRELDNSYTLHTMNDILNNLQPGVWQTGSSGYPYFVREKK